MAKGFCATLGCERLDRRRFATQAQARMAVFTIIGFSNPVRRHSALGYRSPMRHENERLTDPSQADHHSTKTVLPHFAWNGRGDEAGAG
ncbi:hypothetical protein QW694_13085 [Methylobacterium isbiliense]|nr:hypothetical protein [Methylobacterium isbiliense]MDN3623961.1 hypothetical protein [Methylobacterium isbiliense]